MSRLHGSAIVALLGWGVCALGASRPWGYVPLLAGMAVCGAAGFLHREHTARIGHGLYLSLFGFCTAVFVQLIPLPSNVLDVLTPAAVTLTASESYATSRPLSINPNATALGLIFVLLLVVFFVGTVRALQHGGVGYLGAGLVALGVFVALIGIAETSTSWGGVYAAFGLPLPPDSMPHGPFSSRNHYAGWMLMALALTMGYVCAIFGQSRQPTPGQMASVPSAAVLMAIALVQTKSRAGILGLVLAVITVGSLAIRRLTTRATRIVGGLLMLLVLAGTAVTGLEPIVSRFAAHTWSTAHGRLPIWRQATAIASDFSITGSGFNSYQTIVSFYPSDDFAQPYEAAHNDFLQLAAEGGVLLGIPTAAVIGFFVLEARRRIREDASDTMTQWLRIGAVIGLVLAVAQETVDFSLQIPANAALFVVLAAIAVHHDPGVNLERRALRNRRK